MPDPNRSDPEVETFLESIAGHPLKPVIDAVRKAVLAADPAVREGIKWNGPSFRTSDYFATINIPPKGGAIRLILHTGVKRKISSTVGVKISDPAGLLKWLAADRCVVSFAAAAEVKSKSKALQAILAQWIEQLEP